MYSKTETNTPGQEYKKLQETWIQLAKMTTSHEWQMKDLRSMISWETRLKHRVYSLIQTNAYMQRVDTECRISSKTHDLRQRMDRVIQWKSTQRKPTISYYIQFSIYTHFLLNMIKCDVFDRNQMELGRERNWEIAKQLMYIKPLNKAILGNFILL